MLNHSPLACIVPPDLLESVLRTNNEHHDAALDTILVDQSVRQLRAATVASLIGGPPSLTVTGGAPGQPHRTIYDQKESSAMALGQVARSEGGAPVQDPAVNEAYDGFGATYKFYWEVFGRNSIDGNGLPILGLVHFNHAYDNAFWDGQGHMFFGDGDGQMFTRLTNSLDVIGH